MWTTQVVPQCSAQRGWLVPGGQHIGNPTYATCYQHLPPPVTVKSPPSRRSHCRACFIFTVITLTLLLMTVLLLTFLLPQTPAFTEDIVIEVSTLEYPYIANLLRRDARLFADHESGFCRNLRMIITATPYRVGADYRDCQLQAISRYIEEDQPTNIGSIFTLKLTLESSSQITLFTVDRVVDAIIEAVTAGEVGGRLLLYFDGTRVLYFPGLRDPVYPATVDGFLFLSLGNPDLPYDPDLSTSNSQELAQFETLVCSFVRGVLTDPATSQQATFRGCAVNELSPLSEQRRRRRRKRQTSPGTLVTAQVSMGIPAAVAEQILNLIRDILIQAFIASPQFPGTVQLTFALATTPPPTPFTPPGTSPMGAGSTPRTTPRTMLSTIFAPSTFPPIRTTGTSTGIVVTPSFGATLTFQATTGPTRNTTTPPQTPPNPTPSILAAGSGEGGPSRRKRHVSYVCRQAVRRTQAGLVVDPATRRICLPTWLN